MEKIMGENEIKDLEEEIDSAVDRLFVEKKGTPSDKLLKRPPVTDHAFKMEKDSDFESPVHPLPVSPPFLKSVEKMESQLLSLEWEITKENIGKTKEEVFELRQTLKDKPEITSVLNFMEKVLDYMVENEEKIRPPLVKFLLDSKETIKLLLGKEADGASKAYKQLAYAGIQARYSCLEEIKETKLERPAVSLRGEAEKTEVVAKRDRQVDEILNKMTLFLERAEESFRKMEQRISRLEQVSKKPSEQFAGVKPLTMNIIVLKVEERLFGVESDKVYKVFRFPGDFREKYSDQQIIRLKDFEVRLIDLKKLFSIPKKGPRGDVKILTVKDNGEYKGLLVDQVLERLSSHMDIREAQGEYFLGTIHWTYQERLVEIPIIDLKKI